MSDLQSKKDDVKSDNFDFWTVPGNYAGFFGFVFFFLSVFQVVAMIWDAQGKVAAGKKASKTSDAPQERKDLDDETLRIYNAIEKFAKVSMSNKNNL